MTFGPLGSSRPRAVAVVVRGDRLLVIRRRLDGHEYAVLPGGGIEAGETPAQAVVRELAEECTLVGQVVRLLLEAAHGGRPAWYFLVDGVVGEPVLGGEEAVKDCPDNSYRPGWAAWDELASLPLLPDGIGALLRQALDRTT